MAAFVVGGRASPNSSGHGEPGRDDRRTAGGSAGHGGRDASNDRDAGGNDADNPTVGGDSARAKSARKSVTFSSDTIKGQATTETEAVDRRGGSTPEGQCEHRSDDGQCDRAIARAGDSRGDRGLEVPDLPSADAAQEGRSRRHFLGMHDVASMRCDTRRQAPGALERRTTEQGSEDSGRDVNGRRDVSGILEQLHTSELIHMGVRRLEAPVPQPQPPLLEAPQALEQQPPVRALPQQAPPQAQSPQAQQQPQAAAPPEEDARHQAPPQAQSSQAPQQPQAAAPSEEEPQQALSQAQLPQAQQ